MKVKNRWCRGVVNIKKYEEATEKIMINFYNSLTEKEKRRYAALEIQKLGYGGQSYICRLFHCDHRKIQRALEELNDKEQLTKNQIRKEGGGRKSILAQDQEIEDMFWEIMMNHTAGSPMNDELKWTNLKPSDIVYRMQERGKEISEYTALQLLEKHGYKKRKSKKDEESKQVDHRNEQFEKISSLRKEYENSNNPMISVDVKKKKKSAISTGTEKCTPRKS